VVAAGAVSHHAVVVVAAAAVYPVVVDCFAVVHVKKKLFQK